MAEIRINDAVFLRCDGIVSGKLRGRRTNGVHEGEPKEALGFDPWREVLDVDIAQAGEDLLLPLVAGIEIAEERLQLFIGSFGQIHFPDPTVVGEERIDGHAAFDGRSERGTGDRERATYLLASS